jgi:hypothetical protein
MVIPGRKPEVFSYAKPAFSNCLDAAAKLYYTKSLSLIHKVYGIKIPAIRRALLFISGQ